MSHRAYSYIRFSTPEQASGTSQARQLAATRAYCATHGLTLDDTLTFRDLGVSGFSGKNAREGALAVFLQAVEIGKVKRGSYLIIESLDRLSRQEPMIAFGLFQQIITKGTGLRQRLEKREAAVKEYQKAVEVLGLQEAELRDKLSTSKQDIVDAGAALNDWVTKLHALKGPLRADLRSKMAALIRRWVAGMVFARGNGQSRTITIEMGNGLSHTLAIAVDTKGWTGAATKEVTVGRKTEKLPLYDQMFASEQGMGGVTSANSLRHLYHR